MRKHTGSSLEATGDEILSTAETSQTCSFPAFCLELEIWPWNHYRSTGKGETKHRSTKKLESSSYGVPIIKVLS